jgi:hypothetical protein
MATDALSTVSMLLLHVCGVATMGMSGISGFFTILIQR